MFKEKIIIEMKEVFKEIPFGIEHTLKVLKNAEDIMKGENIGEEEKEFISIIAILPEKFDNLYSNQNPDLSPSFSRNMLSLFVISVVHRFDSNTEDISTPSIASNH